MEQEPSNQTEQTEETGSVLPVPEHEKLRDYARVLNFFAILAFVAAIILTAWGATLHNAAVDQTSATPPDGSLQFMLGGSAGSLCVLLAFFAQLYHIRAALEK